LHMSPVVVSHQPLSLSSPLVNGEVVVLVALVVVELVVVVAGPVVGCGPEVLGMPVVADTPPEPSLSDAEPPVSLASPVDVVGADCVVTCDAALAEPESPSPPEQPKSPVTHTSDSPAARALEVQSEQNIVSRTAQLPTPRQAPGPHKVAAPGHGAYRPLWRAFAHAAETHRTVPARREHRRLQKGRRRIAAARAGHRGRLRAG